MQNFADQCLDLARSLLGHNLEAINEDGTIAPVDGEWSRLDEPGHAALAIGEFYRATNETTLEGKDLLDLAARCITAQVFDESESDNGLAYSALGILSFGPAKDRNPVWERLMDPTRECLDKRLLARTDAEGHLQAFNIAKAVTRFSMGLSKKDETGKLIDRFIERINANSTTGFCDDNPEGIGGVFDIYGILSFVVTRQALQLHCNSHLRDRKLPSLRTHAEKYLKLLPDLVRADGLGWTHGRGVGAYGQMHCISLILQAMRDGWITAEKKPLYLDVLRRLFYFFFVTYVDQEHGYMVIRDAERNTIDNHTTRMANFDAARYLCQWSRLAKSIGGSLEPTPVPSKTAGRFILCDKGHKKEQGLFIYQHAHSGLNLHLPLMGPGKERSSDSLAFPHCPGVFDWPVKAYLPVMLPELTFGEHVCVPAYYGKRVTTGLGPRNSFVFRYEQPELITKEGTLVPGIGSCKVSWTFEGNKITSEFTFMVKNQVSLNSMRYVLALGAPHSEYRIGTTFCLGEESLRAAVLHDDFQANWAATETVTEDPELRTYYGNLHYLQILKRDHALVMRPGQQYRLTVSFDPDIALADE
tara:strand:+ start:29065 stop:30822 length:1758 start_codon:yes stop_codon:yes gene_type:complete